MIKHELQQGLRDSFPIVLGYLPLGFTFGVLARDSGLSLFQAVSMSALCFTGAGQFIAVGMFKAGGSLMAIVLTNLLVNLRYALFAASTVPYLKERIPSALAAALSYGLTDEVYAVSMNRYRTYPATASYLIALVASAHLGWIGSSLAGAILGNFITSTERLGMNFALPAMYISLMMRRRSDIYAALAASLTALLVGHFIPSTMANNFNIIAATLIGATLGVIINER
ncbi:MAG TPA: AzlC family ABC transporter permease [Bacillota bacterium]|nr:AzlC family ABC transporter permease [Bacillota bacterium]